MSSTARAALLSWRWRRRTTSAFLRRQPAGDAEHRPLGEGAVAARPNARARRADRLRPGDVVHVVGEEQLGQARAVDEREPERAGLEGEDADLAGPASPAGLLVENGSHNRR
jgi:hypothetical protein